MTWTFQTSKSMPSDIPTPKSHPLPEDHTSPSFSNSVVIKDQAFKHVSLLEPFSFKLLHIYVVKENTTIEYLNEARDLIHSTVDEENSQETEYHSN